LRLPFIDAPAGLEVNQLVPACPPGGGVISCPEPPPRPRWSLRVFARESPCFCGKDRIEDE
jgi:hypothetical protein